MDQPATQLPGILDDIAVVVGKSKAMLLAQRLGGARICFPMIPRQDHPVSVALSHEDALKLSKHFAGNCIDMPNKSVYRVSRDAMIRQNYNDGISPNDIAISHGLSRRQVFYIIRKRGK